MGQDILKQISEFNGFELVSCEQEGYSSIDEVVNNKKVTSDIENLVISSDTIIDFTSPKASLDG